MKRKPRKVDVDRTWEIGVSRPKLAVLGSSEAFAALLGLARIVNLLRFAQVSILGLEKSDSPLSRRQSLASFSLSCALLYEAYQHLLPMVGKHYKHLPPYKAGLHKWRSRKSTRDFVEQHCKPLRSTSTFHVDVDELNVRLGKLSQPWLRFLSSRGGMNGFYYYDLADELSLGAFFGDLHKRNDAADHVRDLTSTATSLALEFLSAADELIASVITRPPFVVRQLPDTDEANWVKSELAAETARRRARR